MIIKARVRNGLLAGSFAVLAIAQSAFGATVPVACATSASPSNVTSCATGVYVNVTALNAVGVTVGPLANAFGTAPAPYNVTGTVASANVGGDLGNLTNLGVTTGIITDTASSPYNGSVATLTSTATSTVNNLDLGLNFVSILSELGITAGTLSSTSTASKFGGGFPALAGSSYITGLVISVLGVPQFSGDITAATPANDVLLNLAGLLTVTANYQTPIYINGTDLVGIQTAALAINLDDYGFTSGLTHNVVNGTILIADSAASVPEPATWAMMLFGFGLVGVIARQRRTFALA